MTARARSVAFGAALLAVTALFAGACGDDDDDDGGNGGGPPGATEEKIVAPYGFKFEIQSAEIPADPTSAATPPTVTFRVTDASGAAIDDLQQRIKNYNSAAPASSTYPYVRAPTFTLSRLEPEGEYRSYYLNQAGNQATGVGMPSDDAAWADRVTAQGNGTYRFELNPLTANPTAEERGRTHTVGVYGSHFPEAGAAEQPASATFNFVPAGGNAEMHQVVSLQACNTCHGPAVRAHGRRLGVQLCITCHTPQTSDPDTGNSVEMAEMIHKIHYGGGRAGEDYRIIGFGGNEFVFDASFINDVRNCTLCHQGEDAARHTSVVTEQSCTTCHSVVKFGDAATGLTACNPDRKDTSDCAHAAVGSTACNTCHTPGDTGVAPLGPAHTPMTTVAQQFRYEIQSVTVGDDRIPTVRVRVLDTANNQARNLEQDPAYTQSGSSLNVHFGWPSREYTNTGASATAPGQTRSVAVVRGGALQTTGVTKVADQVGVYDVTSPVAVPADVPSATTFVDGHPVVRGENVPVVNEVRTFAVPGGGAGQERRQVVSVDKCNACHGVVSAHGQNRNGRIEACVVCHNPRATDAQKRVGIADAGDAATEQTVDFKVMIHAVHAADIRRDDWEVYGFNGANAATGGAPGISHTFPGEIPHNIGNCTMCHVSAATAALPLAPEVLDPVVDTSGTLTDQSDDVTSPATRMVCTSCHDQVRFEAAQGLTACNLQVTVNSAPCLHSGGAQANDGACAACHQSGAQFDTAKYHPIQ